MKKEYHGVIEMTYDEVRKKIFHRLVKQNKLLRRKTRSIESILELVYQRGYLK